MQKMHGRNQLEKIVVNAGIGRLATNSANFEEKTLPNVIEEFKAIIGQYPAARRARISIAGFKIRKGMIIGLSAVMRGKRMEQFLARLNAIVLPRVRDFRGIHLKNIDAHGNLNIGIREHTAFPEIIPENSKVDFGLQVTVVPKIKGREKALELYRALGVPLQKLKTEGEKRTTNESRSDT